MSKTKSGFNIINFPDDFDSDKSQMRGKSIYEMLLQTNGDYEQVSEILDRKIEHTNNLIRELSSQIDDISDSTFEKKLDKLKEENIQTMQLCEEFQKITARKRQEAENDTKLSKMNGLMEKPPKFPVKSRSKPNVALRSKVDPLNLTDDSDTENNPIVSIKKKAWNEVTDDDFRAVDYHDKKGQKRPYRSKSFNTEVDMNITSCPPRPEDLIARWRHKVTVPQPFSMTKRAEEQKSKEYRNMRKSRTMEEFQREKLEREQQEIDETRKQFKANPIPAHVYIPMYESMQEEAQQRRQLIRDYNKEILKSIEQPFNFYKRDQLKKSQERTQHSYDGMSNMKPGVKKEQLKSYYGERQKTIIRARPVPKSTKQPLDMEQLQEEELFRRIKAEIRAKKLMEESKLPGGMDERIRLAQEKQEQRRRKLEEEQSPMQTNLASTRGSVPDFNKIHKQWEEDIRLSAGEPKFTKSKPFNLHIAQRIQRSNNLEDPDPRGGGPGRRRNSSGDSWDDVKLSQNCANNKSNSCVDINNTLQSGWPKAILTSLEIAKPYTTRATLLREKALQQKLNEEAQQKHEKAMQQLARKQREAQLSKRIAQSIDLTTSQNYRSGRSRHKDVDLKLADEDATNAYNRQLEDNIKHTAFARPFLFQRNYRPRTSQLTQQQSANRGSRSKSSPDTQSLKFDKYDPDNQFGDRDEDLEENALLDGAGSYNNGPSYHNSNSGDEMNDFHQVDSRLVD